MNKMKKTVLRLWVLAAAFMAWDANGQGSDVWKKLQQKFEGEPAVYVERSEVLNIVLDGDSVKAWTESTQDILHLKDQTGAYSSKRIYGSSLTEIADIRAKTLVWDKNRYREMNVSSFKKNDSRSEGIFYDDSYYYSFDFPSVSSQNRTLLQYRENIKDIRFISGYLMQSNLPHGTSSYTIRVSKEIDISFKVLNDKDNRITFQKSEKGGFNIYNWTATDVPAIDYDAGSPALSYFAPSIECHIKSYTTKKGTTRVLSDLNDLHRMYNGFIGGLNKNPSPELLAVVEDLKKKSKSEEDIVRNVFYWVQENIKYIAFEQGMRGFIPHPAAYVCEKRYGDCKDMANLIVNMLQLAGVKAYHTWIGTRDLPYKYTEFPTPVVDNHMIATYVSPEGKYIFLDGTSNHTKAGLPSSMIQGKEAFISLSPDKYEVKVVPEIPAEENYMLDSVRVQIDNGKLVGSGVSSYSGYAKVFCNYDIDRANAEEVRNAVNALILKGSNKFNMQKYDILDMDNRDASTKIAYEFTIADYFQVIGDETYVNLNLDKDYYNDVIPVQRKSPREREYKYVADEVVELIIPQDKTLEYLPPDASWDNPVMSFKITYTSAPGKIVFRKTLRMDQLLLTPGQFAAWNEANKHLSEAYKESIVLKKK